MQYIVGCDTDVGPVRKQNQDSYIVRSNNNSKGHSCIALLCDGMGGLSEGDLASNTVVKAFEKWYIERFENSTDGYRSSIDNILEELKVVLKYCHDKLVEYGNRKSIRLGTTLTLTLLRDNEFIAINVGDSRIYSLQGDFLQITRDDTVVSRMLEDRTLTPKEAENSKKKHVLTQCVGVGNAPLPHIYISKCQVGDVLFLCCDGMYHELSNDELKDLMIKQRNELGGNSMNDVREMIRLVKSRGERDNITGIFITMA